MKLLRGIANKHCGDFYCLNCPHSFTTENKRESREKLWENKFFCNVVKLSKDTKILEFNQHRKPDKVPFLIYAGLECLLENIYGYKNNPENSFATKVGENVPLSFLMATIL